MCMHKRLLWHIQRVRNALTGPNMIVGHRLTGPNTSGATSGQSALPKAHISRPRDQTCMQSANNRPSGGLAAVAAIAKRAACAPRTPLTQLATARTAPSAVETARHPL